MADWDPSLYARFTSLRLRPALDLLAHVGYLPEGSVLDLGCGNGAVGPVLRTRFSSRELIGLDTSPAMLEATTATGAYDQVIKADAVNFAPETPPALIFSNALLQWLPDHAALFPRLLASLIRGGMLAVQMPRQQDGPSHALIRSTFAALFPKRGSVAWQPPVAGPLTYARLMVPLGETSIWETDYIQRLAPVTEGHPVRHFTQSTFMRPFLAPLSTAEKAGFIAAYEHALEEAYPPEPDGAVFFPFRRLFITVRRND